MLALLALFVLVAQSTADISGTDPPAGSCICADGTGINVRDSPCGAVIGQINTGQCLEYKGTVITCTMSGTVYDFYELAYGGGSGWVAGIYLNMGGALQCQAPAGCPNIVSRAEWGARPPTSSSFISKPIPKVFVHHTETGACFTQAACESIVRSIQDYHMDSNGWSDIGYNFLVGEDGNAYEGRGWDKVGAHASDWNSQALGISVIGSFMTSPPNNAALNVIQQLISCGTDAGDILTAYTLHGHRDGGCTDCPGDALYNIITGWPHYDGPLPGSCALGSG